MNKINRIPIISWVMLFKFIRMDHHLRWIRLMMRLWKRTFKLRLGPILWSEFVLLLHLPGNLCGKFHAIPVPLICYVIHGMNLFQGTIRVPSWRLLLYLVSSFCSGVKTGINSSSQLTLERKGSVQREGKTFSGMLGSKRTVYKNEDEKYKRKRKIKFVGRFLLVSCCSGADHCVAGCLWVDGWTLCRFERHKLMMCRYLPMYVGKEFNFNNVADSILTRNTNT